MRLVAALVIALTLCVPVLPAQQRPGLALFPVQRLDNDPRSEAVNAIIEDALATSIAALPVEPVPISRTDALAAGGDVTALLNLARGAGARIALLPVTYVSDREVILSVAAVETESERLVTGIFSRSLVGITINNRIAEAVSELTAELQTFLDQGDQTVEVAPIVLRIGLSSVNEGMDVRIAGSDAGGEISGGELTLPFIPYPLGSRIALDKRLQGYHPEREVITLPDLETDAVLRPLWRRTNRSLALHYSTLQMIGAGLGYREYLSPDDLYLSADLYGYATLSSLEGGEPLVHTDLTLTVGRYFILPYDAPFRFSMATGLGGIVTFVPSDQVDPYVDFYVNLATLNLEWNTRRFMVYLRSEVKLTLGIGRNLLGRTIVGGDRFAPPVTLGFAWKFGVDQ